MDAKKPRIDVTIYGRTRRQVCQKIADDIMFREAVHIANRIMELGVPEDKEMMYLLGRSDGFAMCLEMILCGKLDLQEIRLNCSESEQNDG